MLRRWRKRWASSSVMWLTCISRSLARRTACPGPGVVRSAPPARTPQVRLAQKLQSIEKIRPGGRDGKLEQILSLAVLQVDGGGDHQNRSDPQKVCGKIRGGHVRELITADYDGVPRLQTRRIASAPLLQLPAGERPPDSSRRVTRLRAFSPAKATTIRSMAIPPFLKRPDSERHSAGHQIPVQLPLGDLSLVLPTFLELSGHIVAGDMLPRAPVITESPSRAATASARVEGRHSNAGSSRV